MSKTAKCTRNSQIQRNIQNGSYVHNGRFRDYGTLPEDIPSWDYRVRRQGEMLARVERKIRKAKQLDIYKNLRQYYRMNTAEAFLQDIERSIKQVEKESNSQPRKGMMVYLDKSTPIMVQYANESSFNRAKAMALG